MDRPLTTCGFPWQWTQSESPAAAEISAHDGDGLNSAKTVTLQYHAMWAVDVNTGVVTYPTSKKRYEAEDAELSGRASMSIVHIT